MLCQGLRKFIPALTASDVKTCIKTKNYFQTENCRSPDDPARWGGCSFVFFYFRERKEFGSSSGIELLPFLKEYYL